MAEVRFVSLVIVAVGVLLGVARLIGLPPSILIFAGGLASVLLPGPLPPVRVDPLIVLGLILPPLLYAGVTDLSPAVLRHAAWRGVGAGAAVTVALVAAAGFAASLLLPGLDPVACMAIGVAAAVAEPRIAVETGLIRRFPRAMSDGLSAGIASAPLVGVSLSLIAAKAVGGPLPGLGEIALTFGKDVLLGGAVGCAIGYALSALRARLDNPPAEAALSIATPFAAAAVGEGIGVSPIAPLIAAGVVLAWRSVDRRTGEAIASPKARLLIADVWTTLGAVLTGALFFLMGRALPEALAGAATLPWWHLGAVAVVLLILCAAVQFGVSWTTLAHPGAPPVPREGGGIVAPTAAAALLATASGRSVIALAIALALPATLPDGSRYAPRDAVVALVAVMVVASLLIQWAGLPVLLRRVRPDGEAEAERETAAATRAAAAAPEEARRALRGMREADAIGDEALHEGETAAALRARVAEVGAGEADTAPATAGAGGAAGASR